MKVDLIKILVIIIRGKKRGPEKDLRPRGTSASRP
jgi:hypothetical protein